jgi:arsenite-transporting ATPase
MAILVSFWGKGGTGKSTLSAAFALAASQLGHRVTVVSTDAAPTVGLLLCGRSCVKWSSCSGVTVFEADENDVKRLWIERFGDEVYEVVSSIAPVGREIIDYLAGAPGIADQYMLYLVYTIATRKDSDVVVWDTAAAGGSLRLLRVEYELYSHLGDAAKMYMRLRRFFDKLRREEGRIEGKDPLTLISEWRELAKSILDFLSSRSHKLVLVATADKLSAAVTRMLVEEFRGQGIEPRALIVNMSLTRNPCPGCKFTEEEVGEQAEALRELEGLGVRIYTVPRLEKRPKTVDDLVRLTEHLKGLATEILG